MGSNKKEDLFVKIATCFGIGYLSPFPGTLGSALAFGFLPLILLFSFSVGQILLISLILFLLGAYSCARYEKVYSRQDPKEVIIDELVAQIILFMCIKYVFEDILHGFIAPLLYFASFVLFRLFDITKAWPINLVQRKIHGGIGVMLDDLLAAIISLTIITAIAHVPL